MPRIRSVFVPLVSIASLALVAACDDAQKARPEVAASASAVAAPMLDNKLDQAARLAAKAIPSGAPAKLDANQPPPNGIFAPGQADAILGPMAAPKIEVFDDGKEPRIQLHAQAPVGVERLPVVLQVASQGRPVLPPLLIDLVLGDAKAVEAASAKAAGAKKTTAKKADAKDATSLKSSGENASSTNEASPSELVARVEKAAIAGVDPAQLPPQFRELVAHLRGSQLRLALTPTGIGTVARDVPKDLKPEAAGDLELPLGVLEDVLTGLYTPSPGKPVGEGAYWMVTDRRRSMSTDVVRYRVIRVTGIVGDRAILSVDTRQYATSNKFELALGPELAGASLAGYGGAGKSEFEVAPGTRWPAKGSTGIRFDLRVLPPGASDPQAAGASIPLEVAAQVGASVQELLQGGGAGGSAPPIRR
jgi:hypothetical protein